jgi:imidazolonepropionase-like amidohydrolase
LCEIEDKFADILRSCRDIIASNNCFLNGSEERIMIAGFRSRSTLAMLARMLGLLTIFGLTGAAVPAAWPNPAAINLQPIVIENVSVVPMTDDQTVIPNATVLIERGRITGINGPIPRGAKRISGKGKWLIPGLIDMHVHLPSDDQLPVETLRGDPPKVDWNTQDIMTPYIANGVTQILNMDSVPASVGQRNEVESGRVWGPHMALAAVVDGKRPEGRIANTPADGRQMVRDLQGEGYNFVKVYWRLDVETFLAIVDEAKLRKIKVIGHIPKAFKGQLEKAFVPGFGMVAHAEEFSKHSDNFTDADAERFAKLAKQSDTWVTPNLIAMRWIASQARSLDELKANPHNAYMHPLLQSKWVKANQYNRDLSKPSTVAYLDRMVEFHRRLVRAFKAEGVPMVAGTDALLSGVVPGFSLHDELELLVEAGLTPPEALAAATRVPAEWLEVSGDRGTVAVGKRADLVLLEADPLANVANTRRISGIFLSGRYLSRSRLDAMMADLAKRNTAERARFDWDNLPKQ